MPGAGRSPKIGGSTPWNKDLCLSEVWYRRWVMAVLIKTRDGRVVEYDQANPAHDLAIAQGIVEVFKASVPRVRRSFWVGPHRLFDGPSPYRCSHFPYVPFWGFRGAAPPACPTATFD